MSELESDVDILLECLKCQKDVSDTRRTLLALGSVLSSSESKEYFRRMGGLQYVHSMLLKGSCTKVQEAAMYCLASAVENDVFCQTVLTKDDTFTFLHNVLKNIGLNKMHLSTAAFFLLNIVNRNSAGQKMAKESGVLNDLISIFKFCANRICLETNSSSSSQEEAGLWSTVITALSMCVNNPHNEANQRLCSSLLPLCLQVAMEAGQPRQLTTSLLFFATQTIAGNSFNQNRMKTCGGLTKLLELFRRCVENVSRDVTGLQKTMDVVNVLNAAIADHEANSQEFVTCGGVAALLKLLHLPVEWPTQDLLQLLLTLGKAVDTSVKTVVISSSDHNVLVRLLTETDDEEVVRVVKYVLNTLQTHGEKEEETRKTKKLKEALHRASCKLVSVLEESDEEPDKEVQEAKSEGLSVPKDARVPVIHWVPSPKQPTASLFKSDSQSVAQRNLEDRMDVQCPTVRLAECEMRGKAQVAQGTEDMQGGTRSAQGVPGYHVSHTFTRQAEPETQYFASDHLPLSHHQSSFVPDRHDRPMAQEYTKRLASENVLPGMTMKTNASVSQNAPYQQGINAGAGTRQGSGHNIWIDGRNATSDQDQSDTRFDFFKNPLLDLHAFSSAPGMQQAANQAANVYPSETLFTLPQAASLPTHTLLTQYSNPYSQPSASVLHAFPNYSLEHQNNPSNEKETARLYPQTLNTVSAHQHGEDLTHSGTEASSQTNADSPQFLNEMSSPKPETAASTSIAHRDKQEWVAFQHFRKFMANFISSFSVFNLATSKIKDKDDRSSTLVQSTGDICGIEDFADTEPGLRYGDIAVKKPSDPEQDYVCLSSSYPVVMANEDNISFTTCLIPETQNPYNILTSRRYSDDVIDMKPVCSSLDSSKCKKQNSEVVREEIFLCDNCGSLSPHSCCLEVGKNRKKCMDQTNNTRERRKEIDLAVDATYKSKSLDEAHEITPTNIRHRDVPVFREPMKRVSGSATRDILDLSNSADVREDLNTSEQRRCVQNFECQRESSTPERPSASLQPSSFSGRAPFKKGLRRAPTRTPVPAPSTFARDFSPSTTKCKHLRTAQQHSAIVRHGKENLSNQTSGECSKREVRPQSTCSDRRIPMSCIVNTPCRTRMADEVEPPTPAASEFDRALFKSATVFRGQWSSAVRTSTPRLARFSVRSGATAHETRFSPASQSTCDTDDRRWGLLRDSRSGSPSWEPVFKKPGRYRKRAPGDPNQTCFHINNDSFVTESSLGVSDLGRTVTDRSINSQTTRQACPGCSGTDLNSRTFNIVMETASSTCIHHRKIRQLERDFIASRVAKQCHERHSTYSQWKESFQNRKKSVVKSKTSVEEDVNVLRNKSFQKTVFDFDSSSSDEEVQRVSPPRLDASPQISVLRPGAGNPDRSNGRRQRVSYSSSEVSHLLQGVQLLGKQWTAILNSFPFHPSRTAVDLKDKYKRLKRQAARTNTTKKRDRKPPLSMCEERRLLRGVAMFGHSWAAILRHGGFLLCRKAKELRDRWRALRQT